MVQNFLSLSFMNRLKDGDFPSPGEGGCGFWDEFNYNLERGYLPTWGWGRGKQIGANVHLYSKNYLHTEDKKEG